MNRFTGILPILVLLATPVFAQRLQPDRPQRAATAAQQTSTERLIQEIYLNRFQIDVGVNNEQLAKIQPMLLRWLTMRRNVTTLRNNAVASLRQLLLDNNASEAELLKRIAEIDQSDRQARNRDANLTAMVDPELTPLQRAKFRVFMVDIELRLRELVDTVRSNNGNGARSR